MEIYTGESKFYSLVEAFLVISQPAQRFLCSLSLTTSVFNKEK